MRFEFDVAKSAINKAKHGLDFVEAQRLWLSHRVRFAAKTVGGEARYAILGTIGGIHHTVIVTYRGEAIRIISARPASKKETAIYENHKKP